jgi:uncharacterized membrane protein YbhN (UPF0104 family)
LRFTEKIKNAIQKLRPVYQNRWVKIAAQIIVISLSIFYLYSQYQGAGDIIEMVDFDYQILTLALVLTILAVFLGALGWSFTLITLSQPVPIKDGIRIHLLSNLAKYIPGYAWQLIGKAYLTNLQGVSGVFVGISIITELVQMVGIGFGLALVLVPSELSIYWLDFLPQLDALFLRILGAIILITLPIIVNTILKRTSRLPAGAEVQPLMLFYSYCSIFVGWLVFGLAFWLIGYSINQLPITFLPGFVFTLAASIIIGLAIIIVPGSIGVRESIMVFLLTGIGILAPIAVLIAVISRFMVTISEVVSYLFFQIGFNYRRNHRIERLE